MIYRTPPEVLAGLAPIVMANHYSHRESELIIWDFMTSDLLGKPEYGLRNLLRLLSYDANREKKPAASTSVKRTIHSIDGGGRFAQIFLPQIEELSEKTARAFGTSLVMLRNMTTLTRAGSLTYPMATAGLGAIALGFTNIAAVRTTQIRQPKLGINLLSIALPVSGGPFVYDTALSASALRRLQHMAHNGVVSQHPLGFDQAGAPTNVASEVECLMPIGGDRGFGLTLAVQLLACAQMALAEPDSAEQYSGNNSFLLLAFSADDLAANRSFGLDTHQMLESLRRASPDGLRIPGSSYSKLSNSQDQTLAVPDELVRYFI